MFETAKKMYNTAGMSESEWLEKRREGIGGSDASGIVGLNKYKSPVAVYMDKVDPGEQEAETPEAAYWGHVHENTVAEEFKKRNPEYRVQRSNFMWAHKEHTFMRANFDRVLYHKTKGWGILEIKTSSEYRKGEWEEESVPEEYLIQLMHYIAIAGCDYACFAVLIGGNKYREFYVERDQELIDSLIEIERDFWENNVLAENPPALDGSESSKNVLKMLYPADEVESKEIVELPDEAGKLIEEYNQAKALEKEAKAKKDEAQNKLCGMLGHHEYGVFGDMQVKWKQTTSTSFEKKTLKKEHPDLYEKYTTSKKTRRFSA